MTRIAAVLPLLLLGAAPARPAAAQQPPFLEHARTDPDKIVTADACGECHTSEFEVWKRTPHAAGFKTLHRRETAQQVAGRLGFRLIKRNSFCFGCHYTAILEDDELRVVSGVSCESCHGAARDWIELHNDYGEGFDHRNEPAAHRAARIEQSRRAGMRRPSDLYPVVANCFGCHTVPNERLVNEGGHPSGSSDFEFVQWSQGEIRHNFLAASRGGSRVNAERPLERKRVMYLVGRAVDLEYSLRAVAEAQGEGVYARAMIRRVRSALAELQAATAAAPLPAAETMLEIVRQVRVGPGNGPDLLAAAERIGAETRRFLESADGSRLAGLDPLLLGVGTAEELEPEERVAAVDAEPRGVQAGEEESPRTEAVGGAGAESGAAISPRAPQVVGELKRRIRPPSRHRTVGPAKCSGCHQPQNEWWFRHRHFRSADPFFDGALRNQQIARLYGIRPSLATRGDQVCMDCHGTVVSGKESREVLDGVSCESCHGAAGDWLEPHKVGEKSLGERRPGYLQALKLGKRRLSDPAVRAEACTGCHYITEPRLISAGHPSGKDFDYLKGMADVRHWQRPPYPAAELRAAFESVLARRGEVPRVPVARLADVSPGARSSRPPRPGDLDPELDSRPPAAPSPRPFLSLPAAARKPGALGLPPFPEIAESAPVETILLIVRERLELLYRAVSQE